MVNLNKLRVHCENIASDHLDVIDIGLDSLELEIINYEYGERLCTLCILNKSDAIKLYNFIGDKFNL